MKDDRSTGLDDLVVWRDLDEEEGQKIRKEKKNCEDGTKESEGKERERVYHHSETGPLRRLPLHDATKRSTV